MPGAVQLMTMHKAKGLEFPVVVLPHVCRESFPGGKSSERWTTYAHVVPSELRDDRHVLPALDGYTSKELAAFIDACRRHDRTGDDRLAYVGVTRAKEMLIASGHWWGATQKKPRGPSEYLEALRDQATGEVDDPWADDPTSQVTADEPAAVDSEAGVAPAVADGQRPSPTPEAQPGNSMPDVEPTDPMLEGEPTNPMLEQTVEVTWPVPDAAGGRGVVEAARVVAALVDAGELPEPWSAPSDLRGDGLDPVDALDPVERLVADWDSAIRALLARTERSAEDRAVATLPGVLSASATMDLAEDPEAFAERLLRPMPRRRNRYAELGTAFHAWVEARLGVQPLITDEDLPGAADENIGSQEELADLKEAFERLDYARRTPAGAGGAVLVVDRRSR